MKHSAVILLFLFFCLASKAQTVTPCNDAKYTELKAKGIANLTEKEMAYFSQKEKECDEYNKSLSVDKEKLISVDNAIQNERKYINKSKNKVRTKKILWWTFLLGSLAFIIVASNK